MHLKYASYYSRTLGEISEQSSLPCADSSLTAEDSQTIYRTIKSYNPLETYKWYRKKVEQCKENWDFGGRVYNFNCSVPHGESNEKKDFKNLKKWGRWIFAEKVSQTAEQIGWIL